MAVAAAERRLWTGNRTDFLRPGRTIKEALRGTSVPTSTLAFRVGIMVDSFRDELAPLRRVSTSVTPDTQREEDRIGEPIQKRTKSLRLNTGNTTVNEAVFLHATYVGDQITGLGVTSALEDDGTPKIDSITPWDQLSRRVRGRIVAELSQTVVRGWDALTIEHQAEQRRVAERHTQIRAAADQYFTAPVGRQEDVSTTTDEKERKITVRRDGTGIATSRLLRAENDRTGRHVAINIIDYPNRLDLDGRPVTTVEFGSEESRGRYYWRRTIPEGGFRDRVAQVWPNIEL